MWYQVIKLGDMGGSTIRGLQSESGMRAEYCLASINNYGEEELILNAPKQGLK